MIALVKSAGVTALIERAVRLIHSAGFAEGLNPAQWVALRYFSEAPPASRTSTGLARFQVLGLGPVSRTVRTLIGRGLLASVANPARRHSKLISVTKAGEALLKRDPQATIAALIEGVPRDKQSALSASLEVLVCALSTKRSDVATAEDQP